jgi:hypothetical protein
MTLPTDKVKRFNPDLDEYGTPMMKVHIRGAWVPYADWYTANAWVDHLRESLDAVDASYRHTIADLEKRLAVALGETPTDDSGGT